MKKRKILIAASLLVFALASCGDSEKGSSNDVNTSGSIGVPSVGTSLEASTTNPTLVEVIDVTSVSQAVEVGCNHAYKVQKGSSKETETNVGFGQPIVIDVDYEFGNNYTMVHQNDVYDHYELLNGKISATTTSALDSDADVYDGYYDHELSAEDVLAGCTYNIFYYSVNAHGTENLVDILYNMGVSSLNDDLKEEISTDENNEKVYNFSYSVLVGEYSVNYYKVSVSFKLGEAYSFTNVVVKIESYSEENFTTTEVFDENNNSLGNKATLNSDAEVRITTDIVINQTEGERTLENQFSASKYYVTSFNLVDENNKKYNDGDTIDIETQEKGIIKLYITDLNENANLSLDNINFSSSLVDNGNKDTWIYDYETGLICNWYEDENGKYITLRCDKVGTFDVTVSTNNVSYTFTLNATNPAPTSLTAQEFIYNVNPDKNGYTQASSITTYEGLDVYVACLPNANGDDKYTATLDQTTGATLTQTTQTYMGNPVVVYKLTATTAGNYTITFVSVKDPNVTTTMTVEVLVPPTMAQVLNGTYYFAEGTVTFTPASEGATSGSVSIVASEITEMFNYEVVDGEIELTHTADTTASASLSLNSNYELVLTYTFGELKGSNIILSTEETTVNNNIDSNGFDKAWYGTYECSGVGKIVIDETGFSMSGYHSDVTVDLTTNTITWNGNSLVVSSDYNSITSPYGTFTRVGSSSSNTNPTIPTEWYGTYSEGGVSDVYVFDENGITITDADGLGSTHPSFTISGTMITIDGTPYMMVANGDHYDLSDGNVTYYYQVQQETADQNGLMPSWYGTYTNTDESGVETTFILSATGITDEHHITLTFSVVDGTIKISGGLYQLKYTKDDNGEYLSNVDGTIFTKENSGSTSGGSAATAVYPQSWWGTYSTGYSSVTITSSSISFEGDTPTVTAKTDNSFTVDWYGFLTTYTFNATFDVITSTDNETFTKEVSTSGGTTSSTTYPTEWCKTFSDSYGTLVVFTANSFTFDGDNYDVVIDGYTFKVIFDADYSEEWTMSTNYDYIVDATGNYYISSSFVSPSVPQSWYGTYTYVNGNYSTTLVIDANGISWDGEGVTLYVINGNSIDTSSGKLTLNDNGTISSGDYGCVFTKTTSTPDSGNETDNGNESGEGSGSTTTDGAVQL